MTRVSLSVPADGDVTLTLSDDDLRTLNRALTIAATECEKRMLESEGIICEAFQQSATAYRTLAARILGTQS